MENWTPPEPGDIVWCHFPYMPSRNPGPKPRPALVCDVTKRDDGISVTVAYGTSQGLQRLFNGEFAVTKQANQAAYICAGLSFDTKFDLRQLIELPWTEEYFGVPRLAHEQHPKLGSLHPSMLRALQAAYQAVQASV